MVTRDVSGTGPAMRAVVVPRTGGVDVLDVQPRPRPEPGPGEVLVRVAASGVNFVDVYRREGRYPVDPPFVLGSECAGDVVAVGAGVDGVSPGDVVASSEAVGSHAEYALIPAGKAVRVPAGMDPQLAAAAMLQGMTAHYLVNSTFEVRPGQVVLVHAAAGGVGQIMVQWAKALGAEVIATVGSQEKAERARELGADHVILYREQDFAAEVKRITGGKGVPVAYDSVGKDTFEGTLASLGRRGMFVSYGNASGPAPAVEPLRLSRGGSLFFTRPTLFDYIATTPELDESAGALFQMIASGRIKVEIGQTFPLAHARRAHEALQGRETIGASLLIP
jgi:NADPH2:quinone reductase